MSNKPGDARFVPREAIWEAWPEHLDDPLVV
jgi:hypothetical protein